MTGSVTIRFSRREVELIADALDQMRSPDDPDDRRVVLELHDLLEREIAGVEE